MPFLAIQRHLSVARSPTGSGQAGTNAMISKRFRFTLARKKVRGRVGYYFERCFRRKHAGRCARRDAIRRHLFKGKVAKKRRRPEPAASAYRLTSCMKRILLISAVLLGAVTASQAGIHLSIGIGVPLPGVVVTQPAPVVVAPPVVCAPPPAVVVAPPVVVAPAPVYYGWRPGWYGHRGWEHHGGWHRH